MGVFDNRRKFLRPFAIFTASPFLYGFDKNNDSINKKSASINENEFENFDDAFNSHTSADVISTKYHHNIALGGASVYAKDGTAGPPLTGDESSFKNASGVGYRITRSDLTPEMFGAKRDGKYDDSLAINAAISLVHHSGGGVILLSAGSYYIKQSVIVRSKVHIRGRGRNITYIRALSEFDGISLLKTVDFEEQTGKRIWSVRQGIAHSFNLRDFTVTGDLPADNRILDSKFYPAKTIGGIWLFAKNYLVDEIQIEKVSGRAFLSEAGRGSGQDVSEDMPESSVRQLHISMSSPNDIQFHWIGPHDGVLGNIYLRHGRFSDRKGSWAVVIDKGVDSGGFCHHHGTIHAYGHENGMKVSAGNCHFNSIVMESMIKSALRVEGWNMTMTQLEVYSSGSDNKSAQVHIGKKSRNVSIRHAKIRGSLYGNGKLGKVNGRTIFFIGGVRHQVNTNIWLGSDDSETVALSLNASNSLINVITDDQPIPIKFGSGIKNNRVNITATGQIKNHAIFDWTGAEFGNEISIRSHSNMPIDLELTGLLSEESIETNSIKAWLSNLNATKVI